MKYCSKTKGETRRPEASGGPCLPLVMSQQQTAEIIVDSVERDIARRDKKIDEVINDKLEQPGGKDTTPKA